MITKIKAISKDDMRLYIRPHVDKSKQIVIISIIDLNASKVFAEDSDRIMTVFFNDCTPIMWFNMGYESFKFCTSEDAAQIVSFVKRWHDSEEEVELYINCSAGINRSGSVARFAQKYSNVSFDDFMQANPQIKGNDWVFMKLIEADFIGR